MMFDFLEATLGMALTAAPWLLLGLLAAGGVKALLPERVLQRWLGGAGLAATARAAVVGAPLPLCSCGAIPTALALHRGGAGRGPTTAFLIGTPGVGVDSLAISYALLARRFHEFVPISRKILVSQGTPKEWRIGDYGRLRKYSLWDQETSEIGANL